MMDNENELQFYVRLAAPSYDSAEPDQKWWHVFYVSAEMEVFAPSKISYVHPHVLKELAEEDNVEYVENMEGQLYFPVQWLSSIDPSSDEFAKSILVIFEHHKNAIEAKFSDGAVIH